MMVSKFAASLVLLLVAVVGLGCHGVNGDSPGTGSDAGPASHGISGSVSGAIAVGVVVDLVGAANATTTTDASGAFAFSSLADGTYTLTPSLSGYVFDPTTTAVTVSGSDVSEASFIAAGAYSISGSVPAVVISVSLVTSGSQLLATVAPGSSGEYAFLGITNGAYFVSLHVDLAQCPPGTCTVVRTDFSFGSVIVDGADLVHVDFQTAPI